MAPDSTSSVPRIVSMGISPMYRGTPSFSMGIAARFATSMVTTNSEGSICPICRLPISRTQKISTRYRMMVRIKDKIKIPSPPA